MEIRHYNIEKYIQFEWSNQFCIIPTIFIDKYEGDIQFTFQFLFLTISVSYMFNPKD